MSVNKPLFIIVHLLDKGRFFCTFIQNLDHLIVTKYYEVLFPLSFEDQTFTYLSDLDVEIGMRVVAQLKTSAVGFATGVVVKIHNQKPNFKLRKILSVIDNKPVFNQKQIQLMTWISQYYMCDLGSIYKQIIPEKVKKNNYSEVVETRFRLKNRNIEQVEGVIGKRKAAQKALSALMSFGEEPNVTNRQWKEAGATQTGINGLLELDIVRKINVAKKIIDENFEVIQTQNFIPQKPTLIVGKRADECSEMINEIVLKANNCGGICLVLTPNYYYSKLVQEMIGQVGVVRYDTSIVGQKRSRAYFTVNNEQKHIKVVIGTFQALLLPFEKLTEIVVLDEASFRYKNDQMPRLNGRDTAMMLAKIHGANITLTSVVPSLEMYANVKAETVKMVDRRGQQNKVTILEKGRKMLFSKYMIARIDETVKEGGQVVVFQNRRGFAGSIVCNNCGFVPICPNCNVTMALHQTNFTLACHHCDHTYRAFNRCPKCNSTEIQTNGMGTERIVEQLSEILPEYKIARVDSDVAARKEAFGEVIGDMESAKCDIVVATSIILGGLKIKNAKLAIVVNADNMFLSTDFRTSEKIISTLTQLRYIVDNEMIVQVTNSQNPILKFLNDDFFQFFEKELKERLDHKYPPFTRLITIRMIGEDPKMLEFVALELDRDLLPIFKHKLMSPYEPIGERKLKGEFVLEMMIKLEKNTQLQNLKNIVAEKVRTYVRKYTKVRFIIDVDPYV